jgi:hypothetical protein
MGGGADASPLAQVREGLSVYDASGDEIGSVAEVRMADTEAADVEPAQNTGRVDSVIDSAADAIAGGDDDVSTRLLSTGYFRLDSKGLFAGDKYVTPDLIESVDADGVRLNVAKDAIPDPT